jgi:hypothetical protein
MGLRLQPAKSPMISVLLTGLRVVEGMEAKPEPGSLNDRSVGASSAPNFSAKHLSARSLFPIPLPNMPLPKFPCRLPAA